MQSIKTSLTELLDIKTPIIGAPMGYAWSADLAIAVTRAGGFGMTGIDARQFRPPKRLNDRRKRPRTVDDHVRPRPTAGAAPAAGAPAASVVVYDDDDAFEGADCM
ncbi:hypothetical protein EIP86_003124 [Pleurotus ostreatoroseus]|nr:hypothetical protein EIP86_003124 [Pleurotus ostreatoroseus]